MGAEVASAAIRGMSPRALASAAALTLALAAIAALAPSLDPGPASPFRHLYGGPVVVAALRFGAIGGGLAAIAAVLLQAPRLLAHLADAGLSAIVVDDLITYLTLLGLGPLVGALAGDARRQRRWYETLLATQRALADEAPLPTALARLRGVLLGRLPGAEIALAVRDGPRLAVAGGETVGPGSAVAAVLDTGAPLFVPDVGDGPRPRRALVVPLLAQGETIGALCVERVGEVGRRERDALLTLGVHLGVALENARLASRQRRFTDELAEKVGGATRHLEAMDRAKSAFVATASHELRTPLTALLGFSEMLATRPLGGDEVRRLANIIRSETDRLARIVDDLLDLSRLEQGLAPRLARRPVAVAPAVVAAVSLFRHRATHRLSVECEEPLPPVDADPDALDRILKNLVSNAIKYSPAGGLVSVDVRAVGACLEFSVADEGRGIAAEALPRIFEPYYRAPDASDAARGVGLGLAVVKSLVDAHGGSIRVASAPGQGTRVTFALPAVP
ncbi:MAG TPA: ATP-binding protein [Methylomirabilota bacterium]|nr:ATP-binding protein [Methylomirabilota bacterium]